MPGHILRALAASVLVLFTLSVSAGSTFARIVSTPEPGPQAIVAYYFSVANKALMDGNVADFSLVFAPNATLTASNPAGVTVTAHGVPAIERWFTTWAKAAAGLRLIETSVRSPMPGLVLHYETAVNAYDEVVAHCAHVFVVRDGMIVSDDFITFNNVAPVQIAPVTHDPTRGYR